MSASASAAGSAPAGSDHSDASFIDAFGFVGIRGEPASSRHHHHHHHHSSETVAVTDVAWSRTYDGSYSLVAAAGSNGVIVVWDAEALLLSSSMRVPNSRAAAAAPLPSPSHRQPPVVLHPEAVLSQHAPRLVHRLAWHPKQPVLLSASQDSTVLLWERKRHADDGVAAAAAAADGAVAGAAQPSGNDDQSQQPQQFGLNRWFGNPFLRGGGPNPSAPAPVAPVPRPVSWQMKSRFEPKSEAVRDIQWSPFYDDGTCAGDQKSEPRHRERFMASLSPARFRCDCDFLCYG
jgi:WD40 repeat protein